MSQGAVVLRPKQNCLEQPLKLSKTITQSQVEWQRVP